MLQWGRAQEDAETEFGGDWPENIPTLQWGRAQEDAETSHIYRTRCRCCDALQWGRAQEDAETHLGVGDPQLLDAASMGPRPRGRGDLEC